MADARIPDRCGWAARGRWKEAYDAAESDLAEARAEIERNAGIALSAIKRARREQEGRLLAEAERERLRRELEITHNSRNELAETWKARAIKAEAERDQARAQVAMVYEVAAQTAKGEGESEFFNPVQAIRALTPDHAKAALEAYGREKVREGMMRAADLLMHRPVPPDDVRTIVDAKNAILAEMETLK